MNNNPVTRSALRRWFQGLFEGDPIAWSVVGGMLVVLLFIVIAGFFIIRAKKRRDEEWKAKRYGVRKQEKSKFKKLKGEQ